MMKIRDTLVIAAALAATVPAGPAFARMSDAQVKEAIIKQSIASYPGDCARPYNSARNGSRGGGYAPLCYPSDVTAAQVRAYRGR